MGGRKFCYNPAAGNSTEIPVQTKKLPAQTAGGR